MRSIKTIILCLVLMGLVGPGCKEFKFNIDDLELGINLDIVKTNYSISFLDAKSERLIGEEDGKMVKVSVHGAAADCIMDPSGAVATEYLAAGGSLTISLNPYKASPTEENPIKFVLVAELDGYLPTSQPITSTADGTFSYTVEMMEIVNPPEGVEVKQQEDAGEVEGGEMKEDMDVKTDNDEVIIKVNQGTKIKDKKGNSLEGSLKVTLVHFSPTEDEAIESFPGGLAVNIENEDGSQEDGNFVTAGFVAIEITDEKGNKAANFEKGELELDIEIDPETMNPETGEAVKAGDIIPLWSYDEETGEWTYEDEIIVKATPEGLRTTTVVHHLSYYNIDWFGRGGCWVSRRIIFRSTDPAGVGRTAHFDIRMYRKLNSGAYVFYKTAQFRGKATGGNFPQWDQFISFTFAPPWDMKLEVIPYDYCNNPFFQRPPDQFLNLCEGGFANDYFIDITPFPSHDVFVEVYINCTDTGIRTKPTQAIRARYREVGKPCWNYAWVNGGEITISGVKQNTAYELQAYYNNTWQPSTPYEKYIGTETNVVFEPMIVCGG